MNQRIKLLGCLFTASCLTFTAMAQTDNTSNSSGSNPVPSNQAITPTDGSAQKTPMDQGSAEADVQTTKEIRQQLVAMKGLSVDAQNVKIITKNGHVVLRGAVASVEEQKMVEDVAVKVAGTGKVKNKTVIKPVK